MRYTIDPATGCHLYCGALTEKGYGIVTKDGKRWRAHRLAWTEANGPIPDGIDVLHECDVRRCINPDHLFLGTNLDNIRDRHRKGRSGAARRTRHGSAKLTEAAVIAIRQSTATAEVEAAKHGVSATAIRKLRRGETWRIDKLAA